MNASEIVVTEKDVRLNAWLGTRPDWGEAYSKVFLNNMICVREL